MSAHHVSSPLYPATAVKELVENSLDAGASRVTVRFVEHGANMVEVSDDGTGIETLGPLHSHATSKLRSMSDLSALITYGFRGEALASLAALAELTIITRTAKHTVGKMVTYDHEGNVKEERPCPRNVRRVAVSHDLRIT